LVSGIDPSRSDALLSNATIVPSGLTAGLNDQRLPASVPSLFIDTSPVTPSAQSTESAFDSAAADDPTPTINTKLKA
jgi:hypothetical protein